jgi:hypothetical protein|tara:strand:- start:218 stop:436 length:219 start_codon:yes stop_codon:yes gene_type:complete
MVCFAGSSKTVSIVFNSTGSVIKFRSSTTSLTFLFETGSIIIGSSPCSGSVSVGVTLSSIIGRGSSVSTVFF